MECFQELVERIVQERVRPDALQERGLRRRSGLQWAVGVACSGGRGRVRWPGGALRGVALAQVASERRQLRRAEAHKLAHLAAALQNDNGSDSQTCTMYRLCLTVTVLYSQITVA